MSEQEKLGFKKEEHFIYAFQESLKKDASERSDLDNRILWALVRDYDKFIQHIAEKWASGCSLEDQEDLKQHIYKHLFEHINGWKFMGYKFTTWLSCIGSTASADWWRNKGVIRLQYRVFIKVKSYRQAHNALQKRLERAPTSDELAKELGWSEEEVRKIVFLIEGMIDLVPLDQPIGNDENDEEITLGDLVPDPFGADVEGTYINGMVIRECIESLEDIYRITFVLYLEGHTQEEIASMASMLGITQGAVNSRISRAKKMFRQCLKDKGYERRLD